MFEQLAAVRGWTPNLTGIDEPERLRGAAVSAAYFAALGVPPALGRVFTEEDDRPGGPPVAVISDALWARLFSRDPGLVGRTILLDGQATTVAGIMPAGVRAADRCRRHLEPDPDRSVARAARHDRPARPRQAEAGRHRRAGAGRHGGDRRAARDRKIPSGSGRGSP